MAESSSESVVYRNPVEKVGFAQLSHLISLDPELSDGAYRTYALYIKYAQRKAQCFPGTERLAHERGKTPGTICRHNAELQKLGYITRVRRMGTSSITYIEDVHKIPRLAKLEDHHENDPTNIPKMVDTPSQKRDGKNNKSNNNKSNKVVPLPDPKPLTPHQEYFGQLAEALHIPLDAMSKKQQGRLNKLSKRVRDGGYTLEDVRKAGLNWWTSWPGDTGSPPGDDQFVQRMETVRQLRKQRELRFA